MRRGSESTLTNGSIGGYSDILVEEDETKEEVDSPKGFPEEEEDDTPTPTGVSPAVVRSLPGSAAPSVSTEKSSSHKR